MPILDHSDVGLGNGRLDVHFCDVLGDGEQDRGRHGGGHGLSQIHHAGNDDAIDGGGDPAIPEVDAGALDGGLADGDRGFGLGQFGDGFLEVELSGGLFREEDLFAFEVLFFQGGAGPGAGEFSFGLPEDGGIQRGIDFGDDIVLFDARIKIGIEDGNFA